MNKAADASIAKREREKRLGRNYRRRHRAGILALFWPITRNMSLGRTSRYLLHALLFVTLVSLCFWTMEMFSFFAALELLKYDFFMSWNRHNGSLWFLLALMATVGFTMLLPRAVGRGVVKPEKRQVGYVNWTVITLFMCVVLTDHYIDRIGPEIRELVDAGIVDGFGVGTLPAEAWLGAALLYYALLFFICLAMYILILSLLEKMFSLFPFLLYVAPIYLIFSALLDLLAGMISSETLHEIPDFFFAFELMLEGRGLTQAFIIFTAVMIWLIFFGRRRKSGGILGGGFKIWR